MVDSWELTLLPKREKLRRKASKRIKEGRSSPSAESGGRRDDSEKEECKLASP